MIDDLKSLLIFAKTVESGSFRAAANVLGISPSVVSYRISKIEKRYDVALLYRSTRKLSLTDDGAKLFEYAKQMVDATEHGLNLLSKNASQPVGKLNISIPAAFTRSPLVATVSKFALENPGIELSINFDDFNKDLIAEGIDIAIRTGDLGDSSLMVVKVQEIARKLVAAPRYLAGKKLPVSPMEIESMDWIRLGMLPASRKFTHRNGNTEEVHYHHRISVNNVDGMCQMAKNGLGLATLPYFLADAEIQTKQLVELLPDWTVEPLAAYAVWPPNAPREGLTRRLIDFLIENLK